MDIGKKLSDIIHLTHRELSGLPGVGKKYTALWVELKTLYEENYNIGAEIKSVTLDEPKYEFGFDSMTINYSALSANEKKYIEQLVLLKKSNNILKVVNFSQLEVDKVEGVGKKFINTILDLKERLQIEMKKISNGEINHKNIESELIISTKFKDISIEEVEVILLEDVDNFLARATQDEQEIFQGRWGFVEPESTLKKLGLKYNITGERIRQKEAKINNKLILSMRLTQENIWLNLKDDVDFQLPLKMKDLSARFDDERNFYKFLNYICGDKNIKNIVRPDIPVDILNAFFAENGSPCNVSQIKEYLQNEALLDYFYTDNVLDYLEGLGKIQINDDKVYPTYLRKNEAVACILTEYPQGLPWLDIIKIANARNIAKTSLNENRLDITGLFDSEFVYLAGKGVYKSIKYINFSEINIDSIFESLLMFYNETNRKVFHLNEVYHKSVFLQEQDYYVIRYIVKTYGEDYGFYFHGKSRTDSVGLEKGFKYITQKDVILQAMNTRKKPMTKPEIANLLISNSLGHASFYLDKMMNDGQVVQVYRKLYTTPELAYADIDLPSYIDGIQDILFNAQKPVDTSIFQNILNEHLHATYSKYFYSSIARTYFQQNKWYRKQNLYSLYEIKYKSLTDAINIHCQSELNISSNVKKLNKHIAITKEAAQASIRNWQHSLVGNQQGRR